MRYLSSTILLRHLWGGNRTFLMYMELSDSCRDFITDFLIPAEKNSAMQSCSLFSFRSDMKHVYYSLYSNAILLCFKTPRDKTFNKKVIIHWCHNSMKARLWHSIRQGWHIGHTAVDGFPDRKCCYWLEWSRDKLLALIDKVRGFKSGWGPIYALAFLKISFL